MNQLDFQRCGHLRKMQATANNPVGYAFCLDDQRISLNPHLGQNLRLSYLGEIHCLNCQRKTKKSFAQGYCYPCFKKLPQADLCLMDPSRCHYHLGTCRDPSWGLSFCMKDHIVYLANSSGLKVGITRASQIPTRWLDQGALQALPIARTSNRFLAGLLEKLIGQSVSQTTNWRNMLKGQVAPLDLKLLAKALFKTYQEPIKELCQNYPNEKLTLLNTEILQFTYPVLDYPKKITSFNFDKTASIEGKLMGIKGQYLLLDNGVINIRKFTAYHVKLELPKS